MKIASVALLAASLHLGFAVVAHAIFIVDTGAPPPGGGSTLQRGTTHAIAGEFTTSGPHVVNSIEGFLDGNFTGEQTFTVALYTDGGEIPGTEILAQQTTASAARDWHGVFGLSFALAPGTYWVSMEVRSGDTYAGFMPGPVPSPLGNEAFQNELDVWNDSDTAQAGFRIAADGPVGAVPEAATVTLLGFSLAGLSGWAWRRRQQLRTTR